MNTRSFEDWKKEIDKTLPDDMALADEGNESFYLRLRETEKRKLAKWASGEKLGKGDFMPEPEIRLSFVY